MNGITSRSPFLEQVKAAIRVRHYSIRTEQAYVDWIRRFILFHNKRHPLEMGEREVAEFLTYLAVTRHVSPATQNQALNALVFIYMQLICLHAGWTSAPCRSSLGIQTFARLRFTHMSLKGEVRGSSVL
jgi:hypothetical protein